MGYGFKIIVEGDYALYTRPEMKVERVSYGVPTVSAMEGLIKSVYWKPAIRIVIDRLIVFNPIRFINIRRNECKSKIALSSVKAQMKGESDKSPVLYASEERSQRASQILRDVRYGVVDMTPNSSRICQKFIWRDHFRSTIRHLKQYQNDLQIDGNTKSVYFSQISKELLSPKSTKETVPPPLLSALMTAALQGTPYPTALLATIVRRVKTDSDGGNDHLTKLNPIRAGIIKACLNRNYKEEIQMAWDETNRNPAYLCGSLFAVYEKIQKDSAAPAKLNRTITDSYFASACSRPNVILPRLEKLSQNHLKKLSEGAAVYYQKLLDSLMNGLEGAFPSTLSLDDQGRFIVGYHQMNSRLYTKNTEQNTEQED